MYAIASQLAPTKQVSSGLTSFESDDMRLRCFQSVTGINNSILSIGFLN
jgi:hypothetical protein